ncbi:MAG TPA: beta-propeller domain-containing protein, partial [Allosphingosinicella sp.]|nr:beta-propeller domain-containing protein [Allosphingosinicella sp.]
MPRLLLCALATAVLAGCGAAAGDTSEVDGAAGPRLKRFASARAFDDYVEAHRRKAKEDLQTFNVEEEPSVMYDVAPPEMESAAQASASANPAITNNQTVGVDEGGIVKQVGRYLVMLQDGRLFSADLGAGSGARLRLADRVDVYRSPATAADWYDEMLVLGDRILVTAYNYRERASEITAFRIDAAGRLTREGRFLLSSDDYYSTENYATRLVGDQLVFYAPFALDQYGGRVKWPRLRRADGDGEADEGQALIGPTDVYAPPGEVESPVVHTVSVCPLKEKLDCRTTAFVGAAMREFYVSPTDAFLWIGAPDGLPWSIDYANRRRRECPADRDWQGGEPSSAMLYRLPLDGGAIGAVAAEGVPADQFAFDSRGGRF